MSSLYLFYCLENKYQIDKTAKSQFVQHNIKYSNYFTTPTPLNNWLWYLVAANDSGYNIGYISVFDKNNINFHFFSRNDSLLTPVIDHEDVQHLLRFSRGFYTVEKRKDTLVFNDLRFGQITGWQDASAHFVFHYYLEHENDANKLVVQRGRFENWNWSTVKSLIKRIGGN
jgi:inner membrane protein